MCYVGFVSACRLFRCDLPRVFDWRNSLPIVHLFLSTIGHSRYYIFFFFLLFSLRASYRSPSETLVVTLNIHIYIYSHIYTYIYMYIIMSHHQHGYFSPFLATPLHRPLLLAGPQCYIQYQHRAVVCRCELDVGSSLCLSMWRSSQEYITYEFIPTSPAMSCISASFNFDGFRNVW